LNKSEWVEKQESECKKGRQPVGANAEWGKTGAAQGSRTPDLRITNALLYQLS
jgi:hypothetical protein